MIDIKTDKGQVERCHFSGQTEEVICDMMLALNLMYNGMKGLSAPLAEQFRKSVTSAAVGGELWMNVPVAGNGGLLEIGVKPRKEGNQ